MSIALYVGIDGRPADQSIVIDVRPDQDVTELALGLSEIFGSADANRLWVLEGGSYRPLGDDVARSMIGEDLAENNMFDAVLCEGEPTVIRGSAA